MDSIKCAYPITFDEGYSFRTPACWIITSNAAADGINAKVQEKVFQFLSARIESKSLGRIFTVLLAPRIGSSQ